ncbi:hypothetical protein, partial [Sutterella wadsworthensis]|uniref:hypothetical protein n=1 Tax=Sutterella wadsworthensis TaxID=40545 RepID=UPI003AF6961E
SRLPVVSRRVGIEVPRDQELTLYEYSSAEMKCLKARSHKETLDSTPAAARLKAFPRIVRERTD